jgi:hypothetical protein
MNTTLNTNNPQQSLHDVLHGMISWRKTERDLERIASDPASLPGYDKLPAGVQALAGVDPMSFWMLWQLSQEGVDLNAIDALGQRLDQALRNAGWDGEEPPSDAQFDAAEKELAELAPGAGPES